MATNKNEDKVINMENKEQKFTVKEVIIKTIELLQSVGNVPLGMIETYGLPVERSINNLFLCVQAMERTGQMNKEKENETGKEEGVKEDADTNAE